MTDVSIREASKGDVRRVAELVHGEPGAEAVALMGTPDLARQYGEALMALEDIPNGAKTTVVAETAGNIMGVLQYSNGASEGHGLAAHVRILIKLTGPIGFVRRIPLLLARRRVNIAVPPDSLLVGNLHVDPASQGSGVGSALLVWAAEKAEALGVRQIALITIASNPSLAWYERHGFHRGETVNDATYERLTGIPGRVLLEKPVVPG